MRCGGKRLPATGSPCTPAKVTATDAIRRSASTPSYHARPKLPAGDSPYVRAKHAQLVEKDPDKAVPLFWAAINSGDRIDSALKDMALVMKQVNRAEEAIEAIKSFRSLCPTENQEPLDNILLELYKKCGRIEDQIELLSSKLKLIDEGIAFGGRTTKPARSQGKKFHITLEQEKSRLLGNLAWAYMQCENYEDAELLYRKALEIEPDYNKQSNLAVCLMQIGRLSEAKVLLESVRESLSSCNTESFIQSFKRASEMLIELDSTWSPSGKKKESKLEPRNILSPPSDKHLRFPAAAAIRGRKHESFSDENVNNFYSENEFSLPTSDGRWKRESKGIPSMISCNHESSRYLTTNEGKWLDGPGNEEASVNIYNRRWNSTYGEAICSPVRSSRSLGLETRGPWTDPKSSVDKNQNFETPINNQDMRDFQQRTHHRRKEYRTEDKNPKLPGLPIRSQGKASKRLNFDRWNKEHFQISNNVPASVVRILKPLAEDSLIVNGGQWAKADQEMDNQEKCAMKFDSEIQMPKSMTQSRAVDENVQVKAFDKQSGLSLKTLVNGDLYKRPKASVKGTGKCGNEATFSNVSDLEDEYLKAAQDSSDLISWRRPSKEHAAEKCRVEKSDLRSNNPIQSPKPLVEETQKKPTVNRSKMDIFREKVAFGSWKGVQYLNADPVSSSNTELPKLEGTCVDMVEEGKTKACENWKNHAASIHTISSSKYSYEEHFCTPTVLKNGRTGPDMVEEEEREADENLNYGTAITHTTGSLKDSFEDRFQTQPVKKGRRTWADMVEEEELLSKKNSDIVGAASDQQAASKSSVPLSGLDKCESFQDENVNSNIMGSAPQRHRVSQKFTKNVCRKLEMVDLQDDFSSGREASTKSTSAQQGKFGSHERLLDAIYR